MRGVQSLKASTAAGEKPGPGTRACRNYIDVEDLGAVVAELQPRLAEHWAGRRVHGPVDQAYGQRELMVEVPDGELMVFGQAIFGMPVEESE